MAERREKPTTTPQVLISPPSLEWAGLPRAVQLLRARILQTTMGGDIDDLRVSLGWNEVPPLFMRGQKPETDPIALLKERSFDGKGLETLAILRAVFTAAYVSETRGGAVSFVWPVFPEPLERAPPPGLALARWRCVRFADLAAKAPDGGPLIHRASIGQDGTWHYFWTGV